MNRKIPLGLTIALMAIAAAITFIISTSYSMNIYNGLVADVQQRAEMYQKLEQIDSYVRAYYDGTIDEDRLIEALANGYISIIEDADAKYMTAQEYALYREHLSGSHIGIGVYTFEDGGYPTVNEVIANSPAAAAGITVGDSIIEINGQSCLDLGFTASRELLRSSAGTQLELTLRSGGVDRTVAVTTIQMSVATVSARLINGLGYFKISEFNEKTYQQFMAAYSAMQSQGMTGMIVDLRNNSGEQFDPAVNILSALLPIDATVAVNVGRDGKESVYATGTGQRIPGVPIVVLVNERTSGPAELFAAALKDHHSASILGMTTAGEGDFFESYSLYDGTAIVLPISTMRSFSTAIEGVGIKPDYEVPTSFDDTDDALAALDETTDPVLKRGIEVVTSLIPPQE